MESTEVKLKHCWSCDKWHPATTQYFHRDSSKGDGLHGSCKWCTRARKSKWQKLNPEKMREQQRVFFENHPRFPAKPRINKKAENNKYKQSIKKLGCCVCCGEQRPEVLQFHHREPKDKLFSLYRSGSRDRNEIVAEIAKCDLMCANCHISLHYWEHHK